MQILYAGSIKSSRMIGKELNRTKNEDTLEMEIVPLWGVGVVTKELKGWNLPQSREAFVPLLISRLNKTPERRPGGWNKN